MEKKTIFIIIINIIIFVIITITIIIITITIIIAIINSDLISIQLCGKILNNIKVLCKRSIKHIWWYLFHL